MTLILIPLSLVLLWNSLRYSRRGSGRTLEPQGRTVATSVSRLRGTMSTSSTGTSLCSLLAASARSSVDSGMCDLGTISHNSNKRTSSTNDLASFDAAGKLPWLKWPSILVIKLILLLCTLINFINKFYQHRFKYSMTNRKTNILRNNLSIYLGKNEKLFWRYFELLFFAKRIQHFLFPNIF